MLLARRRGRRRGGRRGGRRGRRCGGGGGTGGASGIGAANALRLAAEGATVLAVDRDAEGLQRTVAAVPAEATGSIAPHVADVSDEAAVAEAVATAVDQGGGLDVVANIAMALRSPERTSSQAVERPMPRTLPACSTVRVRGWSAVISPKAAERAASSRRSREPALRAVRPVHHGECQNRRPVELVDLPAFGRPARLVWSKRRWSCPARSCPVGSFTESAPWIAAPRLVMTDRAGRWVTAQVGRYGRPVADLVRELGCDWHIINDTVLAYGTPLVEDPNRIGTVEAWWPRCQEVQPRAAGLSQLHPPIPPASPGLHPDRAHRGDLLAGVPGGVRSAQGKSAVALSHPPEYGTAA